MSDFVVAKHEEDIASHQEAFDKLKKQFDDEKMWIQNGVVGT